MRDGVCATAGFPHIGIDCVESSLPIASSSLCESSCVLFTFLCSKSGRIFLTFLSTSFTTYRISRIDRFGACYGLVYSEALAELIARNERSAFMGCEASATLFVSYRLI